MKTYRHIIYVVDDSPYNLRVICKKLKATLDCKVRLYKNAQDCRRALDRETPDLILTDYNLSSNSDKKINGDWLLKAIKEKSPDTPVILYSSIQNIHLATHLMRIGAVDFIPNDEKFFEKITSTVKRQLDLLKEKKNTRNLKILILAMVVLLPSTYFILNYSSYEWPFYFSLSFLIFSGIVVFLFGSHSKRAFKPKTN